MQRDEWKWREMIEYLEGGRIPQSKYPRATLDQFLLEEGILYLARKNIDNTLNFFFFFYFIYSGATSPISAFCHFSNLISPISAADCPLTLHPRPLCRPDELRGWCPPPAGG